ncbi:MAG: SDR family oxidoreductase [Planctomycetota bacterium]|jgi:NAD(P)-dependent dehydrogenase (short-subunit alcohol dehydrogenase family)|nr:SDR family oxidoreductase [Planctomycetota bacterium]
MKTTLITGTNRGIGLEMVRQYAANGWHVLATCRNPDRADALQQIAHDSSGAVEIEPLDVTNPEEISALGNRWKDRTVDVLINNAGFYGDHMGSEPMKIGKIDYPLWTRTLAVNTLAPMAMVETFLESILRSKEKKIVTLSSRMGSVGDNTSGGSYLYRSSKAAINAVTKSLAIDLSSQGIIAVVLHPGWVLTDMGGPNATLSTEASVRNMLQVITKLEAQDNGRFLLHDGTELPW